MLKLKQIEYKDIILLLVNISWLINQLIENFCLLQSLFGKWFVYTQEIQSLKNKQIKLSKMNRSFIFFKNRICFILFLQVVIIFVEIIILLLDCLLIIIIIFIVIFFLLLFFLLFIAILLTQKWAIQLIFYSFFVTISNCLQFIFLFCRQSARQSSLFIIYYFILRLCLISLWGNIL
ncbi:transmembrane protein, putative (macronuclear) [Tetrahymena thermophila SB210]|uniref:Transmembrane protein, putative n=1 Tax=Tetrahymena thermophila (strain SB210) TaxID=312017 RepID=W7X4F7_TETTS|nr:transmembrane protein, putative [Tetrahymena thermophila SB210]EWS74210.1 transmembrane protein, putative [Tetrahymena thermophila SB210]|eukprot:XP_012653270.1 transmembrane protein, putative [Tetrahymena thermophila SB210]